MSGYNPFGGFSSAFNSIETTLLGAAGALGGVASGAFDSLGNMLQPMLIAGGVVVAIMLLKK